MKSADLYQRFIARKRVSGLSERTVEAYNYAIQPFIEVYPEFPVSSENIESFIYQNQWSQQKRAFVHRHLGAFCRWAARQLKQDNPMLDVLKPRVKLEPIRYLNKEEIGKLYAAVSCNKKHQAIILTLLDTGIRVGELLSIKICNLDNDILQVNGKSGPRVVAISPAISQLLKAIAPSTGYVFNVDRHTIYRITSYYLTLIGFEGKKGPHIFRHTFAIHALRNGMDIISVSKTMGHKTIVMTEQYLRLAQKDITETHSKFSPLSTILEVR